MFHLYCLMKLSEDNTQKLNTVFIVVPGVCRGKITTVIDGIVNVLAVFKVKFRGNLKMYGNIIHKLFHMR